MEQDAEEEGVISDLSDSGWAYQVRQADLADVQQCDGIFAIVNGNPPDEGVMIELGIAMPTARSATYALNKAIFLFRDDFRRCSDSEHL